MYCILILDYLEKGEVVRPLASVDKDGAAGSSQQSLKQVDRIRSVFPETWLWSNHTAGYYTPVSNMQSKWLS